jgi:glucose-1-phosphate thymidylyltransferase
MKAVILAAGKGSRLFPVTRHIPKPILPLANRPTLEYAFDRLKEIGVREVCVVVGESEPAMRAALGDGARFGIELSYVRQTEPKGLAHAVGFAEEFVARQPFVLYLGDAIYSEGFERAAARFSESGCANLNIVKPVEDPSRFGVANVEGERIVKLVEKPARPESNLAMAGLYFFGPTIWDALRGLPPSARGEYEITDAIQRLVDAGETVLAGVYEGEWFDTGTLDSFLATSRHLTHARPLTGPDCEVKAEIGSNVVIGAGAHVTARRLEDCVILPGARVAIEGEARVALLGGEIASGGDLRRVVAYGDEQIAY